jgi:hypothetical protein
MEQLALIHEGESADEIWEQLRLCNVILIGSDLDRGVFGAYLADGILNVSKHLSIYMSQYDIQKHHNSIIGSIATLPGGVIHHMVRSFPVSIANRDTHTTTPAYIEGLYVLQKSLLGCALTDQ